MKNIYLAVIFLLITFSLFAQSTWETFSSIYLIYDVEIFEDKALVCHNHGFAVIDLGTEEIRQFNIVDEDLEPTGTRHVEVLSNGDAWVTDFDKRLFRFSNNEFLEFVHDELNVLANYDNFQVHNDTLWFTLQHTLYSIQDNELENHKNKIGSVFSFSFDNLDRMWVDLGGLSLAIYSGEQIFRQINYNSAGTFFSYKYFIDSKGAHWLAGGEVDAPAPIEYSIFRYENGEWSKMYLEHGNRIEQFFELKTGAVLFLISSTTLGVFAEDSYEFLNSSDYFPEIPSIYGGVNLETIDDAGNFWISSVSDYNAYPLYKLSEDELVGYGRNDSSFMNGFSANSILVDCEGDFYTSSGESFQKYQNETFTTFDPDYNRLECQVSKLFLNPYTCERWAYNPLRVCGSFWKFDSDEIVEYEILSSYCDAAAFDPKGNLYFLRGGDLYVIDAVGIESEVELPDFARLYSIMSSQDSSIWMTGNRLNDKAIIRFKNGEFTYYGDGEIDFSNTLVFEDSNQNIWAVTSQGLAKFDGIDWEEFPLDLNSIYDIVEDENGSFWIATRDGLGFWNKTELIIYNVSNSNILSDDSRQLAIQNDEYLWISHTKGLSRLKLSEVSSTQAPLAALPEPQFTLYPNPSAGPFYVKNETVAERRYEVYDIEGRLVLSETSEEVEWSSLLAPGVYIVKVISADVESVRKLVVN